MVHDIWENIQGMFSLSVAVRNYYFETGREQQKGQLFCVLLFGVGVQEFLVPGLNTGKQSYINGYNCTILLLLHLPLLEYNI